MLGVRAGKQLVSLVFSLSCWPSLAYVELDREAFVVDCERVQVVAVAHHQRPPLRQHAAQPRPPTDIST
eukprot:2334706-Rhodomonas_salina.2